VQNRNILKSILFWQIYYRLMKNNLSHRPRVVWSFETSNIIVWMYSIHTPRPCGLSSHYSVFLNDRRSTERRADQIPLEHPGFYRDLNLHCRPIYTFGHMGLIWLLRSRCSSLERWNSYSLILFFHIILIIISQLIILNHSQFTCFKYLFPIKKYWFNWNCNES